MKKVSSWKGFLLRRKTKDQKKLVCLITVNFADLCPQIPNPEISPMSCFPISVKLSWMKEQALCLGVHLYWTTVCLDFSEKTLKFFNLRIKRSVGHVPEPEDQLESILWPRLGVDVAGNVASVPGQHAHHVNFV